jgi:hypothetical protein
VLDSAVVNYLIYEGFVESYFSPCRFSNLCRKVNLRVLHFLLFFKQVLRDIKCLKPSDETVKKAIVVLTSDHQQL